jgi:MFS family permease
MPANDTAGSGEFRTVGYMRMTTFIMLILGVFLVVAGLFSDVGAFGIVFGLLMIVSAVIKVAALRILKSTIVETPRVEAEER